MKKTVITFLSLLIFLLSGTTASAANLHVSHNTPLSWSASYNISTSGNTIKKVSNIKTHAYIGKLTNKKIIYTGSNKVTLKMIHSVGSIKYNVKLSATIKNGKLTVTT